MEKDDAIQNDSLIFADDIRDYLNGVESVPGSQNVIGFKMLFRGYVVRDWFGGNVEETKYEKMNKVIVQSCVKLYNKC